MKLISHPQYLAPVPLYARLFAAEGIIFDADTPFVKQTFRNRAVIVTGSGTQTLTIPVMHNGEQPMRDVRISEHGNWRHLHWNAIVSAYRKSPFFDYYADDFAHFYEERDGFLLDFNLRLHTVVCSLLGLERECVVAEKGAIETEGFKTEDLRHAAEPRALARIAGFTPEPYYQVFAPRNGFIAGASIVDLLFNMGPEALITLRDCCRE